MATFASDTFTGTPGAVLIGTTPTVGGVWTNGGGGASTPIFTGGGSAVKEASGGATAQCYIDTAAPSADYSVQVTVSPDVGGSGSYSGVIGRKVSGSTSTFYLADYGDVLTAGSRVFRLFKCVAGAFTELGTSPYTTNIGTTPTTLKLTMSGSSLTVYVGGVSRITATDSAILAAGYAGIRMGACTDPTAKAIFLDDFSAFDSAASPAPQRRRPSGLYIR